MDAGGQMPRVFISYADTDIVFAEWLADGLKALGHAIRLHREALLPGAQQFEQIHQALEDSAVMLLVITPTALKSRLLTNEWAYFLSQGHKILVPVLLEPPVPPDKINFMLAALEHADFSRGDRQVALGVLHHKLLQVYASQPRSQAPRAAILPSYQTRAAAVGGGLEPTSAGLTGVHMGLPIEQFGTWLRQGQTIVRLLNTWTAVFADHGRVLVEAVRRGTNVQVLLLDPSSAFARQRSMDVNLLTGRAGSDSDEVPHNIRTSIRQIASLDPEIQDAPGKLELRLYNALPSFSVYQCDKGASLKLRAQTFQGNAYAAKGSA